MGIHTALGEFVLIFLSVGLCSGINVTLNFRAFFTLASHESCIQVVDMQGLWGLKVNATGEWKDEVLVVVRFAFPAAREK